MIKPIVPSASIAPVTRVILLSDPLLGGIAHDDHENEFEGSQLG